MREERGTVSGELVVYEEYTLWGTAAGTVRVIDGGRFYLRGAVFGDIVVEAGGRMHIFGRVSGNVTIGRGTKVIHGGVIGGNLINEGGRLFLEPTAKVNGKTKTMAGETKPTELP